MTNKKPKYGDLQNFGLDGNSNSNGLNVSKIKMFYSNRDCSYAELRKENGSNKTRRLLYDRLQQFYKDINLLKKKYY